MAFTKLLGDPRVSLSQFLVALLIIMTLLSSTPNTLGIANPKINQSTTVSATASPSFLSSLALTEWTLPSSGGGPWGISTDSSGKIWFTENITSKIGRFDPSNNQMTEWSLPNNASSPRYISPNATGSYFTEYSANRIGFLNPNGTVYEWQLAVGSNPVGIYVEQNNTVWFTESGTDIIARLIPGSNQLTEWKLPGGTSTPGTPLLEPWGIYAQSAVTGVYHNITDRSVWFTMTRDDTVGMLQVSTSRLTLWYLDTLNINPSIKYGPTDITLDATGDVFFTSSIADKISELAGGGAVYQEYQLPPHASTVKPTSLKIDAKRNSIWFTEYNPAIIGSTNTTVLTLSQGVPTQSQCTLPPAVGSNMCPTPSGQTTTTTSLTTRSTVVSSNTVPLPPPSTVSIYQSNQAVAEYRLPNSTSRPNSITLDSAGNIWFTESNQTVNRIGRLSIPYVLGFSVTPAFQSVIQGHTASYSLSVGLLGGTAQSVQLSLTNASNLNVNFSPQTGIPPLTSTLTIGTSNSTALGLYTMTVVANSSGLVRTAVITMTVGVIPPPPFDFGLNVVGNNSVIVPEGDSASVGVGISLSSAPAQIVSLTASGFPSGATGSFTTASGTPPYTSTLNIQTSIDTPAGSYPITITGSSAGGLTHSLSPVLILTVLAVPRDFNMTASASSITLVQASRADLTLTISSVGAFTGNVSLSGTFTPSDPGLSVKFTPSTVSSQLSGGVSQITVEIVATRNTPGRTYQLTVTGTSTVPSRIHQVTVIIRVSPCLIATAAFGSELSPEVQFLRTFRDQQVIRTFAGSSFMTVFNAWYYSFSPGVAQFEYAHSTARTIIRLTLYPLIGILHLSSFTYSVLGMEPEFAVLASGVVATFLIGLIYLAIPVSCLIWFSRRRNQIRGGELARWICFSLSPMLLAFILAEVFNVAWLMMIASSTILLGTLASATALGVRAISGKTKRRS